MATLKSSKISTSGICFERFPDCYPRIKQRFPSGLCCEWFPDCYPRIKQRLPHLVLWMIPLYQPSIPAWFPHLALAVNDSLIAIFNSSKISTWYSQWMIPWLLPSNLARFPPGICCEWLPDCYPPSRKISIPGICCEWFPDCYPPIKQDFYTWSLLRIIPRLLASNQ